MKIFNVTAMATLCLTILVGAQGETRDAARRGPFWVGKPDETLVDEENAVHDGTERKLYLGFCQTDCDSDSDCSGDLVCFQRAQGGPIPSCCSGGVPSDSRDFCITRDCNSGGGGGGDTSVDVGFIACFSAGTVATVLEKGAVPMKDLQIGDQILSQKSGQYHYQPVYSFAHHHPTKEASFKILETEDGHKYEISAHHLIYVEGKRDPVRADSVRPGDKLAPTGIAVKRIGQVTKTGIYAPMTPDGTFLLDGGIQVSSYAALVQDTDAQQFTFKDGTKGLSQHSGIHMVLTPYRMWCRATGSLYCDSYNSEGMPHYVANGINVLEWVDQQANAVQWILFGVAYFVFGSLIVMECILFSKSILLAFFVSIFGNLVLRKRQTKCT